MIRAKTRRTYGQSFPMIFADINRTLRGWFGYFKHGPRMLRDWMRRHKRVPGIIGSRKRGRPVILLYHSIDWRNGRPDVWDLSVAPQTFLAQMEVLAAERTVISLNDLVRRLSVGRVPTGCAAVTFDDGYANNLLVAEPILNRLGIPATMFLVSGTVGTSEFWWDRLERMLTDAAFLPERINLRLADEILQIRPDAPDWDHRNAVMAVWSRLRDVEPRVREEALQHLSEVLAVPAVENVNRPLAPEEVRQLAGSAIEVGAHSISHPWLPRLLPTELAREVAGSKHACEDLVGRPVSTFAYPFGVHDSKTRAAVVAAGYTLACATTPEPIQEGYDRFALPRMAVSDWSSKEFSRRLHEI